MVHNGRLTLELSTWNSILRSEFAKPYWRDLMSFVAEERVTYQVFPPPDEVFAALHLTALADVKVVILGQDPYHGPHQAHGLCFSVNPGVRLPPSLVNIYQELEADLGIESAASGDLRPWARQGVLLLNTALTVRAREAGSHQGRGWETFTDAVIATVNTEAAPSVFILWGASARRKRSLLDLDRHRVIESAHPSPLSAHRGFFRSAPFSRANNALVELGRPPVEWRLSSS